MASTPNTPSVNNPSTQGVLIPTKDLILINESEMSIEIMTDLVFEDIGGQELISFLRHNNVNGLNVEYIPIKYLSREHIIAVGGVLRFNNFLVISIPVSVVSLSES